MPDFWQFPTVSMGLAPLMAIYQARLIATWKTGLLEPDPRPRSGFTGDGEMDEPEALAPLAWQRGKTRQSDFV
jgi:pyruvate dehydrogenase E1 component